MTATARQIELLTPRGTADNIALRGVHLRSRLSGMSQRTTVEQTFVNLERRAIEAVYTFPLPEGAAVCGFEIVTGDRVLTGTVDEAEAAAEKYDEAIARGHAAYALEQERPDVFTVRVGNLEPHQAATIRVTYVCALERVDKSIRIVFPTTIAPRYISGVGMDALTAAIDGSALNPPHVLSVPYGLSMEVEIDLGRELIGITSPTHGIIVSTSAGNTTLVNFAGGVAEMDRDVVLSLSMKKEAEPSVQVASGPDKATYLAVTFVPEFDVDDLAEPAPGETVFVLDCSGSMQGESIAQAMSALELCLRSLSAGDRFNVCRFGSTFEMMASEPLAYCDQSLAQAINYVRQCRDLGGTELYGPLQAILTRAPAVGAVRQVILLTDGQVSNEPAVIQLARSHRARNRIFSFGIGSACSAHLVRGIARATGGAAEFISGGERIDEKVLRTFGRMASPQLTDVSIEWDGCDVQTLAELPPVFDGDVLAIYGRAEGRTPRQVTLIATTRTGRHEWRVPAPASRDDANTIATMWARRTLQSLEDVNAVSLNRVRKGKRSREAEQMIRISKDFGLLCPLTSFVALEHRSEAERNEGRPALRRVPVKLAAGWGAIPAGAAAGAVLACLAAPAQGKSRKLGRFFSGALRKAAAPPAGSPSPESLLDLSRARDDEPSKSSASFDEIDLASLAADEFPVLEEIQPTDARRLEAKLSLEAEDDLLVLLARQTAGGSFSPGGVIERLLAESRTARTDWKQIVETHLPPTVQPSDRASVVTTTMVILLFMTRFADREPVWRRACRKALRLYLPKVTGKTVAEVEAWIDQLKSAGGPAH